MSGPVCALGLNRNRRADAQLFGGPGKPPLPSNAKKDFTLMKADFILGSKRSDSLANALPASSSRFDVNRLVKLCRDSFFESAEQPAVLVPPETLHVLETRDT